MPAVNPACSEASHCIGVRALSRLIRRSAARTSSHDVDAELRQVVESPLDPGEIPDAIAVAVREAARVDLADDRGLPPLCVRDTHGRR